MRNTSIITKIVLSTCAIISILLIGGSLGLLTLEKRLVEALIEEHIENVERMIDEREQAEKTMLHKNIQFNAEIFGKVIAGHLYRYSDEHLKLDMKSYMEYPEILAMQVLDENGLPFAAAWKTPDIMMNDVLPQELNLKESVFVDLNVIFNEEQYGTARIYYTEDLVQEKIRHMKQGVADQVHIFHQTSKSSFRNALAGQGIGIGVILLTQIMSLMFLLRGIVLKPLMLLVSMSHRVAALDLTVDMNVAQHDEIGKLFASIHNIVKGFRTIVTRVQASGVQISTSSEELAVTARQQEITMANQVESTRKVVASVNDISDVAENLVETMQQVASLVQEAAGAANKSQASLLPMQEAMSHMENASKLISARLETINEKTENITTVVTTVNKVSDQTNLLSLNAAIEAEKAGEHGRGFSVVAREIRRLADQTAFATLDIEQMVQEMQSAVVSGIMEMDKFMADVRQGASDVGNISTQLTLIIDQVQALQPNFEHVNQAMSHQSEHTRTINQAMQHLTDEMQQTKDSLHETYSAIERLNEISGELHDEVLRFKITE